MFIYSIFITFLFGSILGFFGGYLAKVALDSEKTVKVLPHEITTDMGQFLAKEIPAGGFVEVNKAEMFLKENEGKEVSIGDILEEE